MMRRIEKWAVRGVVAGLLTAAMALGGLACAKKLPGTEITETEDSRAIYDVMDSYLKAIQAKDVKKVMALVDPEYFETSGTEAPEDDYGYAELNDHLTQDMERTQIIRIELHLKDIMVEDDKATAIYRYRTRAQVRFPAGDQWITENDVNRMSFHKRDGKWLITSGL